MRVFNGDYIFVLAYNSLSGAIIDIAVRILLKNGHTQITQNRLVPTSDRLLSGKNISIQEGELLSVTCIVSPAQVSRGQCFVSIQLKRDSSFATVPIAVLAQDYVSSNCPVSYPGTGIHSSIEGRGYNRIVQIADPAAGGGFDFVIPEGALMLMRSIAFTYTASAAAANRYPLITLSGTGVTMAYRSAAQDVVTANQMIDFCFSYGGDNGSGQGIRTRNMPELILSNNQLVSLEILSVSILDTVSDIWTHIEEWILT